MSWIEFQTCQSQQTKAPRRKTLPRAVQMRTSLWATVSRRTISVRKIWRRRCRCSGWMTTRPGPKQRKTRVGQPPGEACCLVLGHVAESSVLFWGIGFLFIDSLWNLDLPYSVTKKKHLMFPQKIKSAEK